MKDIYNRLFLHLVDMLNLCLKENAVDHLNIGLLDIYGFEVLNINGFEQMMINYTNEKFHQLYVDCVFKAEQNIFEQDGLVQQSKDVLYNDNQHIIDIFDKNPTGLFYLLDESNQMCQTDA